MKLSGAGAERFFKTGDERVTAVLLFGPDHGLIEDRAASLLAAKLDDPNDPFALDTLSEADLKADPVRLGDALAALSFSGGRRLVRVRGAGEAAGRAVQGVFKAIKAEALKPAAFLLIEAGELTPRSALRKTFEKEAAAAAIGCYAPAPAALGALVGDAFKAEGLDLNGDARTALLELAAGDRALAKSEAEKLILYKRGGDGVVSFDDVQAVGAASPAAESDFGHETIAFAVGEGRAADADAALGRAFASGAAPVSVLRGLARHFERLDEAAAATGDGVSLDVAMRQLRPPVFFSKTQSFSRQIKRWRGKRLERAQAALLDAERAMKRSGAADRALLSRLVLALSR